MSRAFADLTFTPAVRALQELHGSRRAYSRLEGPAEERLSRRETEFIQARDGFYLATVSETGWPYVQFRGGPPGFLRARDDHTLEFTDLRGNKQFLSLGNLATNDRVALFLMDYPHQERLKIWGRAAVEPLPTGEHRILIQVTAFDWNCHQHIPQRLTPQEWKDLHETL